MGSRTKETAWKLFWISRQVALNIFFPDKVGVCFTIMHIFYQGGRGVSKGAAVESVRVRSPDAGARALQTVFTGTRLLYLTDQRAEQQEIESHDLGAQCGKALK